MKKRGAITAFLLLLYSGICLYMDRRYALISIKLWYLLLQISITILTTIITIWLPGWLKILSFALLSLTFVELCQQIVNGNTSINISDDVSLIIVSLSLVGFILMRKYKKTS